MHLESFDDFRHDNKLNKIHLIRNLSVISTLHLFIKSYQLFYLVSSNLLYDISIRKNLWIDKPSDYDSKTQRSREEL